MNVLQIDHIGIAVRDLSLAGEIVQKLFGCPFGERSGGGDQEIGCLNVNGVMLEYLSSAGPDTAVGKFLEKRGEGVHHIALRVDDIDGALRELEALDIRLVDRSPKPGLHGTKTAFIHPSAANGVLIELVEHQT